MKKLTKIMSVLLAVVMLAGILAIAPVTANAATPAWKTAYINYINRMKNEINDGGWGWIKDLDGNGVPELFLSFAHAMGATQVITYYNGNMEITSASAYGTVYVQNNMFLLSYGRQGHYGDTVYRQNGTPTVVFDGSMAAKYTYFDMDNPNDFTYKYSLNGSAQKEVSYSQYKNALNSVFNVSKAGVLNYKNCYHSASQIIAAINKYNSSLGTPTTSLSNTANGLYASWNKISGASYYTVFYKKSTDSSWSSFNTTNTNCYIPNAVSGKLYYVQVLPVSNAGITGGYSKVKSMTYLAQTSITSLSYNGYNNLKYNSVGGANKYQIARLKSGDKSYTYFTATGTSFSEYATGGIAYTYQVRPMYVTKNSGTAYGAWSSTKSVATLVAPTVTLSSQGNAVVAKWNSIRGAVKYIVYFKSEQDTGWKQATTTNLSLPITGVKAGERYYVQVRPIGSKVNGPYSAVKSIIYVPPTKPVITSISNSKNGVYIKWNLIPGATKYIVYYKAASDENFSSFKKSGNFKETIFGPCKEGERYYVQLQPEFNGEKGAFSPVYSIVHYFVY